MREKALYLVVSFPTTADAMQTERLCRQAQLPGRLMPAPRSITADCGIAWCAPIDAAQATRELLEQKGVETETFHELWL